MFVTQVASDEKEVQSNSSSVSTVISNLGGSDRGIQIGFWLSVRTRVPCQMFWQRNDVSSEVPCRSPLLSAGRPGPSIEVIKSFASGATTVLVILVCQV